ncbi:MAG: GNAT family N-acetyltransferase [Bacteroidales bacterium]|jgi:ribosomal protein S18 acetylase RimI-like enzyme|nr:GNAT family N-acetyltransferase [Bacteroidales bacterium]
MLRTTLNIKVFDKDNRMCAEERKTVADFLYENLEDYGDPEYQIEQAIAYALGETNSMGGFLIISYKKEGERPLNNSDISGAVVINKTGMSDYIPEYILVYIATSKGLRGQGIGKGLLEKAVELTEGSVALHVEPRNPAKHLYEKIGFTNKYLEMRYQKED